MALLSHFPALDTLSAVVWFDLSSLVLIAT